MKQTLLQLTNDLLSSIESEEVGSISDTQEADQVVKILNRAFYDIATSQRWKHLKRSATFQTNTELNELKLPDNAIAVDPYNLYYNGQLLSYYEPEEFLSSVIARTGTNVVDMDGFNIYNDQYPTFFTAVNDDKVLKFDSIEDSINGLDSSLAKGFMYITPARLVDDEEYFDLPAQAYPALVKLALSYAYYELKGDENVGKVYETQYLKHMSQLERTGRYIDKLYKITDNIIARPTRGRGSNLTTAN